MESFTRGKDKLERFDAFLEGLAASSKVAVLFDRDPDGAGAGIAAYHALSRLAGTAPKLFRSLDYAEINAVEEALANEGISHMVLVDVAIDTRPEYVTAWEKQCPLLILDHHKLKEDLNSARTTFLKPQMLCDIEPSQYPTAKFAYDLFSRKVDLSFMSWLTCAGILGDVSYEQWKGFVDAQAKAQGVTRKDLEKIAETISAVETVEPKRFDELIESLRDADSAKEALASPFSRYREKLEAELAEWTSRFEKEAESFKDIELFIFTITPKHNIKSVLSTRLSLARPHITLLVLQDRGDGKVNFSARRQDMSVPVNDMIEQAVRDIPGAVGGGHVPAAAGTVPKERVEEFKKAFVQALEKHKKN